MELALWCDLRVIEEDAVRGVFCRRWGVPLSDGGTVRLARLIGMGNALDLILTGRPVGAEEALVAEARGGVAAATSAAVAGAACFASGIGRHRAFGQFQCNSRSPGIALRPRRCGLRARRLPGAPAPTRFPWRGPSGPLP